MDQIEVTEKTMRRRVDNIVPQIAETLRVSKYSWEKLSSIGSMIFLGIACIMLFARTDLFNVLLGAICYYASTIDRKMLEEKYMYIMGVMVASLLYDLIWFAFCGSVRQTDYA